jgi:pimeloyl-ACP methyl ester carboxylesterase
MANERDLRSAFLSEMRAVPEFAQFLAASPILSLAPRGDGHPVLVLPGWTADDRSTRTLRWYLRHLGYGVHGWGLGVNEGLTEQIAGRVAERLRELGERYGDRTVSLVGWSLGGVYARALARQTPGSVRTVITLGSPINASRPQARGRLPVPSTSIYSRSDAIVPYRLSLDTPGPRTENVEVRGSHVGLGHNAAALLVVADRLAQPEGSWKPFTPPATLRRLFPSSSDADG